MTVQIRKPSKKGDETLTLTEQEAKDLSYANEGRYFIVNSKTNKVIRPIEVSDGQELMFIPIVTGG